MLVMLSDKQTRNAHLWCNPSTHVAREVRAQDALVRTPLWSTMKAFLGRNGLHNPKLAERNSAGQFALCPQVLICPPPLQGHHPMVTSPLDCRGVIIQLMKDGEQKPQNLPQQETPVPCMPCNQTPWQPTSGPSGTQWPENLLREPPQHNGPPIQSSESQVTSLEEISACEPEPETDPTQSTEEPFDRPATPHSVIIIDNTHIGSPLHSYTGSFPGGPSNFP
ncbi:hypothetical protein O181_018696 [Austropuccinia psidii MF-1]|uniref:Uncharacterized protein n=1 Tax=Austropuccinia psidii MF-1 TaxID=1389203 RepID=A0A9Q3C5T0_9BASI|nr:hypothetical protein [Austropuccinia psidii MF-1]